MGQRVRGKRLNGYIEDYVVFDLETTGLDPKQDAIIEISAVRVEKHKVTGEFSTLVNAGRHIPARATAVNGITDAMVKDAPGTETAMKDFLEFIGNQVLVGHNIHSFDMNFVCEGAQCCFGREVKNDYIDTLYMARSCLPELSRYRLTDVAAYFGIQTEGAHRALYDCIMNQRCYEEMGRLLEKSKKEGTDEEQICPRCGGVLVLRKGKFGKFYGCSGYPACRFTRNAR